MRVRKSKHYIQTSSLKAVKKPSYSYGHPEVATLSSSFILADCFGFFFLSKGGVVMIFTNTYEAKSCS